MGKEGRQSPGTGFDDITAVLDSVHLHIWFLTDSQTYGWANQCHADFIGLERHNGHSRTIQSLFPPEIAEEYVKDNSAVWETRQTRSTELWLQDADGIRRLLSVTKAPKFSEDGKEITGIVCIAQEMTDAFRKQVTLSHAQEKPENISKELKTGIWEWDVQEDVVTFYEGFAEILGYTPKELQPMDLRKWEELIHPDDRSRHSLQIQTHVSGDAPSFDCEYRLQHKNGAWVWVHSWGKVISYTEDQAPKKMHGVLVDISLRKQAQQDLESHTRRMKNILSLSNSFINITPQSVDAAIHQGVCQVGKTEQVDRCFVFLFDDERGKTMSNTHEWCAPGIQPQKDNLQMVPTEAFPWWLATLSFGEPIKLVQLDDLPEHAKEERNVLQAQSVQSVLAVPLMVKRSLIGFVGYDSVKTSRQWGDDTVRFLQMTADIFANNLERKRLETQLLEGETDFIGFIDSLDDIVIISDLSGSITHANQQASDTLDYSPEGIIYLQIFDLFPLEHQRNAMRMLEHAQRGYDNILRIPFISSHGTPVPVETRVRYGKWNGKESVFLLSRVKEEERG